MDQPGGILPLLAIQPALVYININVAWEKLYRMQIFSQHVINAGEASGSALEILAMTDKGSFSKASLLVFRHEKIVYIFQ